MAIGSIGGGSKQERLDFIENKVKEIKSAVESGRSDDKIKRDFASLNSDSKKLLNKSKASINAITEDELGDIETKIQQIEKDIAQFSPICEDLENKIKGKSVLDVVQSSGSGKMIDGKLSYPNINSTERAEVIKIASALCMGRSIPAIQLRVNATSASIDDGQHRFVASRLANRDIPMKISKSPLPKSELSTLFTCCLLYTSPSPRDGLLSRMPSSA